MRAILAHHVWRGHDSLPSPNGFERFGRMRRPLRHTPIRNRCGKDVIARMNKIQEIRKRRKNRSNRPATRDVSWTGSN